MVISVLGLLSCMLLASIAPHEAFGQLMFLMVGISLFVGIQFFSPRFYASLIPSMSVITVSLLAVTLVVGKISHGAMRWLPIGPFHLQISEFAKPVLALVLSLYVSRYPLTTHQRILGFLILSAAFILPVFLQPDLGSSMVLAVISLCICFLSVRKISLLLPWIAFGCVSGAFLWTTVLYGYQKDRVSSFISGSGNASYNAQQAYITVGSGKLLGRGLGHGVQSQLRFLPEFHTDFFFASLAEELGFIGVLFTILLYVILYSLLIAISSKSSLFSQVAMIGLVCALFFQMVVNIGMNIKLFPITGIPLPFLSSGGSSFLSLCIGIGVLVRVCDER